MKDEQSGARTDRRRADQRERLILMADAAIANGGLPALRARDLARDVGCSVGAIYNLVGDLDELVLLVAQRTMGALGRHLDATEGDTDESQLIAWALAYAGFAAANRNRWDALFTFRMRAGFDFPDWFAAEQRRIFVRLETRLAALAPHLDVATREIRARTLFSAVHGIVALGLDGKLVAMPVALIDQELRGFVETYVAGLRRPRSDRA